MPISEDEYDSSSQSVQESKITMSKAELRKTHKPIMEKKRRARINQCLNEIKSLVLEAMNKDPSRHTKLEKADILEMAVKHLQSMQRQQLALAMATDPSVVRKFKAGFHDCAEEIDKFLNRIDGVGSSVKQGLSNHLNKCITGIEQMARVNFSENHLSFLGHSSVALDRGDDNNNPYFRMPQLRPGELSLLLSNLSNVASFRQFIKEPQRPSAFATVIPSNLSTKLLSPPLSPKKVVEERCASPQGFRPVQPTITKPIVLQNQEPQVCQISSSSNVPEIQTIKYPMNFPEKKFIHAPTKFAEPLCVITNQSERYKQAQVKEDSAHFEENIRIGGVKRKFGELHQGLLVAAPDAKECEKRMKLDNNEHLGNNRDQQEGSSSDMWRPW